MQTWIMFIFLISSAGNQITTQDFNSREACMAAAQSIMTKMNDARTMLISESAFITCEPQ